MTSWDRPSFIDRHEASYPALVLINVLFTTFLAIFSAVIPIISDNAIQGELALNIPKTTWLGTLYLLGINTTVPAASWFADRFGTKTMYAFGVGLFTLSSALAAFSFNFAMIAIARALEGIGAGFIFPVGLAKIVETMAPKKLPMALVLYVAVSFGGGFALGPPLCGFFTQFYSWRYNFLFIVPIGALGFFLCWLFHRESERNKSASFDVAGFFCFATFIATLLIALTYGPLPSTNEGWRSPYILLLFAIAFFSLLATLYVEKRAEDPIIPISLFKDPFFAVATLAMFLLGMSIFASMGTSMNYMINALGYEKFVCGKIGIIYGSSLAFFSFLSSLLIKKKMPLPILTFFGLSILVLSYFLNNELSWLTGVDQVFWILFLRGMGLGLSLGPTTIQAMQHVPHELANKGASLLTFFRQVGGTYGGTLIAIVTIKRQIFHAARFSEPVSAQIPGYKVTFDKLFTHFYTNTPEKSAWASPLQAKGAIIANIENQAYIQALNDGMLLFGYVTGFVALLLITLSLIHHLKKTKASI